MGSLTTCDPSDIAKTLSNCKQLNVRCSVISLAAEVRIMKELTKVTGGEYGVILDDLHFRDLLHAHLEPPPSASTAEASLIKMGFPCHSGKNLYSTSVYVVLGKPTKNVSLINVWHRCHWHLLLILHPHCQTWFAGNAIHSYD